MCSSDLFFQTDVGKALKLASLASNLSNLATEGATSEVGGVTGPDNIDVGGGFNPAASAAPITAETITQQIQSPAAEQIAAEQAAAQASAEQFAAEQAAAQAAQEEATRIAAEQAAIQASAPVTAESITQTIATPAAEQIAAENAAMQMTAEQFAAEQAAAAEAARIAAENAAMDAALQDLANSASPVFAASAAAQGLTFKQGLDAVRAGLLINAITGDPLGLNDVVGKDGNTFANQGFAQVPIPSEWKSPTYTDRKSTRLNSSH